VVVQLYRLDLRRKAPASSHLIHSKGHKVTSLDCHPVASNLLLTASNDHFCKLFDARMLRTDEHDASGYASRRLCHVACFLLAPLPDPVRATVHPDPKWQCCTLSVGPIAHQRMAHLLSQYARRCVAVARQGRCVCVLTSAPSGSICKPFVGSKMLYICAAGKARVMTSSA
jgi:hypothetical protein